MFMAAAVAAVSVGFFLAGFFRVGHAGEVGSCLRERGTLAPNLGR